MLGDPRTDPVASQDFPWLAQQMGVGDRILERVDLRARPSGSVRKLRRQILRPQYLTHDQDMDVIPISSKRYTSSHAQQSN